MRLAFFALIFCFGFSATHAQTVDPRASKTVTTALAAIQKVFERKMPPKRSFVFKTFASISEAPAETDDLANKLATQTDTKDCQFILPVDQDPSNPPNQGQDGINIDIKTLHIEVKGDQCPLAAVIDVVVKSKEPNIDAVITMNFEARTPEVQKEIGMTRLGLTGNFGGHVVKMPDGSGTIDVSAKLDGLGETLNFGDVAQTIQYGVKGEIKQPADPNNPNFDDMINIAMTENQRYANAGKETKLGSTTTMKGLNMTAHYFVGDKEVSADEYKKYQSDLQLPGFQQPGQDNGGGSPGPVPGPGPGPAPGSSPMMCVLQVFDAAEVSLAKLQQYLAGGQGGLPGFPLQSMTGCSSNVATSFPYKGQTVGMSLQFGPEFIVAQVTAGQLKTPIYAQNDDKTAVAGQTGGFTHMLVCNPVAQCH